MAADASTRDSGSAPDESLFATERRETARAKIAEIQHKITEQRKGAEWREAERLEAERREAERREAERREAERREAEKREAERRKAEQLEAEKREIAEARREIAKARMLKFAPAQIAPPQIAQQAGGTPCTSYWVRAVTLPPGALGGEAVRESLPNTAGIDGFVFAFGARAQHARNVGVLRVWRVCKETMRAHVEMQNAFANAIRENAASRKISRHLKCPEHAEFEKTSLALSAALREAHLRSRESQRADAHASVAGERPHFCAIYTSVVCTSDALDKMTAAVFAIQNGVHIYVGGPWLFEFRPDAMISAVKPLPNAILVQEDFVFAEDASGTEYKICAGVFAVTKKMHGGRGEVLPVLAREIANDAAIKPAIKPASRCL